jgi:hypothetical protein
MARYSDDTRIKDRFVSLGVTESVRDTIMNNLPSNISVNDFLNELFKDDLIIKEIIGRITDKMNVSDDLLKVIEKIRNGY